MRRRNDCAVAPLRQLRREREMFDDQGGGKAQARRRLEGFYGKVLDFKDVLIGQANGSAVE
jgi:hypothetical protein